MQIQSAYDFLRHGSGRRSENQVSLSKVSSPPSSLSTTHSGSPKMNTKNLNNQDKESILDSMPEDVVMSIIGAVKGMASIEGNLKERDEGRRARDLTLRNAALSSKKNLRVWLPFLLQNVTMSPQDLVSFHRMIRSKGEEYGSLVNSMHFKYKGFDRGFNDDQKKYILGQAGSKSFSSISKQELMPGIEKVCLDIWERLGKVEILILEEPHFCFPFQLKVQGSRASHPVLSTLKKLYIGNWSGFGESMNLSGRNVIGLLVFCPLLKEAAFDLDLCVYDLKFFSEFHKTYDGLSKVENLAITINYVYQHLKRKTYWFVPGEPMRDWIGGNKKTEALMLLLKVTSQLKSLEVVSSTLVPNVGDSTAPLPTFISTLHRSEKHLKHLRLIGIEADLEKPGFVGLDSFRAVKILTLDRMPLFCLLTSGSSQSLPQDLETIYLPFYMFKRSYIESGSPKEDFVEEVFLCQLLRMSKTLLPASFKEIVVPLSPISMRGIQIDSTHVNYQKWVEGRSDLEKEILNTKGRIKLRKVKQGAIVGDASELFMSSLRWLSD